jgi:hypothetical protein
MLKKIILSLCLSMSLFTAHALRLTAEEAQNSALLIQEVKNIGALSVNGRASNTIMSIALDFAKECANNYYSNEVHGRPSSARLGKNTLSHVGFKERCQSIPGHAKGEILAFCTAYTAQKAAKKLAQQWLNSPGHNAIMMPYQARYAYALVRTEWIDKYAGYGWFAIGLFAD